MLLLLVVDVQNDFVKKLDVGALRSLVESINELAAWFEARRLPIFFVETEHAPDGSDALAKARAEGDIPAVRGTRGAERPPGLVLPPSATRVVKTKYSAFHGTSLLPRLQELGGPLVVAGVNTHACVRASVVDAVQHDLPVIVARDCVRSYDEEYHRESLRYFASRLGDVLDNVSIMAGVDGSEAAG